MRTILTAAVLTLAAGPGLAQGAADEGAVRALAADMQAAWDANDAEDWAALFAEDGEAVLPRGLRLSGREAVRDGHAGVFASIYRGTTLDVEIDHVRFLTPDVALLGFHQTIQAAPGSEAQGSAGQRLISTLIARRADAGWVIEYADSIPAAPSDFALPTAE